MLPRKTIPKSSGGTVGESVWVRALGTKTGVELRPRQSYLVFSMGPVASSPTNPIEHSTSWRRQSSKTVVKLAKKLGSSRTWCLWMRQVATTLCLLGSTGLGLGLGNAWHASCCLKEVA